MINIKFEDGVWKLYFNDEFKGAYDTINEAAAASEKFRNKKGD